MKKTIYINPSGEMKLSDALEIMTDEWIESGNVTHQTVIDLRNALINIKNKVGENPDWFDIDTQCKINSGQCQ